MNRWLHIELPKDRFYHVDCSKVTHVYYDGTRTISIYTVDDQLTFEFNWEDAKAYSVYKEHARTISNFIEGYDLDSDIMLVSICGSTNVIKITKRSEKTNVNIS